MGVIQSVFCSVTFCLERVLTWTSCAMGLILIMSTIVVMMIYGISVGYHYAQKELSAFAMTSRSTTEGAPTVQKAHRRAGVAPDLSPVVRFVAVNRTQAENYPSPVLEIYRTTSANQIFMEPTITPVVLLETERPPQTPELSPHEKELARRLIGRFRRSQNNVTSFFRPLKNMTLV